jgi:glycerol-3-phosphate dehydrogenase (NAD(P)+)
MAKVTVLGAGMMGSALCVPLVDAGHEVRLVGTHLDREIVQSLADRGFHPKLGLELPRSIRAYPLESLHEAMQGVELVGVGVSSAGVGWAGERLARFVRPGLPLVMISKGLEWNGESLQLLPDVLTASWPDALRRAVHPAAVAGPCIAGELGRRVPTCVVLTGRESAGLERLSSLMSTSYYHVSVNPDVVGVELCAALKNAYALGVGLAAGLHEARGGQLGSVAMHNYEAAVFAQAMLETERWVTALGGSRSTVVGLPGTGDLTVTCNGGRTSRFGRWLGLGLGISEAVDRMAGATLECLDILRVLSHAMPTLECRGLVRPSQVPLLVHLMDVALAGAPVNLPFERFFGPE